MPYSFYDYFSVVEFEIKDGDTSGCSFIVQDCFSRPGFFIFSYEVDTMNMTLCYAYR